MRTYTFDSVDVGITPRPSKPARAGSDPRACAATVRKDGTLSVGEPVSGHSINLRVNKRGEEAGIGGHLAAHDLRRSWTTLASAVGASIERMALLMGRTSIDITKRYIHTNKEDLRAVAEMAPMPCSVR